MNAQPSKNIKRDKFIHIILQTPQPTSITARFGLALSVVSSHIFLANVRVIICVTEMSRTRTRPTIPATIR